MAEFNTDYSNPMDRPYHTGHASGVGQAKPEIEGPIITIGELGQTVPETDPSGKFKNMVQGVQAALRAGSKNIQLVLTVPPNSPMGGRPKAYGQEVRQAMKELFVANQANLIGIEMPTSMNNLSGFDPQQGVFSETTREKYTDEVKEAIRLASDIGQGGGIDIVSWEFQRPISAIAAEREGFAPEKDEIRQVVEADTGRIIPFRVQKVERDMPFEPGTETETGIDENGFPKMKKWKWDDFVAWAELKSKQEGKEITPEELVVKSQFDAQVKVAEGYAKHYMGQAVEIEKAMKAAKEAGDTVRAKDLEIRFQSDRQLAIGQMQQADEAKRKMENILPVSKYAKEKSMESYAELGIAAMDETLNNPRVKSPIHVGPELGWPHAYGGHPKEFVELIKGARAKMAEKLETDRGMNSSEAKRQAEEHIQGMLDTGHLGMWLEHFKPTMRYTDRLKEFNKWFMGQIDYLAGEKVIGGIQAVDSAGAAHGHLPPGQGIFPVVDAVRRLKEKGFKGYIVSEGHEEERFGEGRILLKTWQSFNAPIESRYGPGVHKQSYDPRHQGYFGRVQSPRQMFGSYTPPFGEYKPWSEIPFE